MATREVEVLLSDAASVVAPFHGAAYRPRLIAMIESLSLALREATDGPLAEPLPPHAVVAPEAAAAFAEAPEVALRVFRPVYELVDTNGRVRARMDCDEKECALVRAVLRDLGVEVAARRVV